MINVIAFVGKAGSGKTTASEYLQYKGRYTRLRFADRLKDMLRALGLLKREIDGDLKECACDVLGGKTPRHAMITLGTEWGRDMIYPNIWVDALDRDMRHYISTGVTSFIIDDLRFTNEAMYIDLLDKTKYRTLIVGIERKSKEINSTHISETQMDTITPDHMIYNNYDMETFYKSIDEVIDLYFKEE
jgi:hypothetical protein